MKKIFYSFVFLILFSFSFPQRNSNVIFENMIFLLNKPKDFTKYDLNYSGIYMTLDSTVCIDGRKAMDVYKFVSFCAFYRNGLLFYNQSYMLNDSNEVYKYMSIKKLNKFFKPPIGTYEIIGDSIYVILNYTIAKGNGAFKNTFACLNGFIKNKDTITNWRVVPPYPYISGGFLKSNWQDTIGETLVFKPFPAKTKVDSTNFWIKQYITNKIN